jgi:5-methyltetrahydropteroyltriglutamate--homocysteine methyltransferase
MVIAANLGFPRIGHRRELKRVLEQYWQKKATAQELLSVAQDIRKRHWQLQKDAGIEHIPSNDFSLYDHILDAATIFGAIPQRYGWTEEQLGMDAYFHMARGCADSSCKLHAGTGVSAMEMTKWFDTNYHYIVPELQPNQSFKLSSRKPIDEFNEAKALGIHTRPVLIGPVSFLLLSKMRQEGVSPLSLLDKLLPVYCELLTLLKEAGADWVQIDEPCLVLDLEPGVDAHFAKAYKLISEVGLQVLLATYFSRLGKNLDFAVKLPVQAIHLDLSAAPEQLENVLKILPPKMKLSAGVIEGRNVWTADLERVLSTLEKAKASLGADRLIISPSCSLLHVPIDVEQEKKTDPEIRQWLAFAKQKVEETRILKDALEHGRDHVADDLRKNARIMTARQTSTRVHNKDVAERMSSITDAMLSRKSAYPVRSRIQRDRLHLPMLPTTTIGSFPQTKEVREVRADFKSGKINAKQYEEAMKSEIKRAVSIQEEIDIDVLVHGEAERNDMVEYFAEHLDGYLVSEHGWVQSYGSRYVKPPIIFGDIVRPKPITVDWSRYAQSLTKKPMKGMLTGPVTMLQWSFVRNDQPRSETCMQLAAVIRDEVLDLEKAGISIIQIDEPAIREGLPLHKEDWKAYLDWAVKCFRLGASGVQDQTQIHTHMCYSEFNDIIHSVAALDADVVSIETARSQLELLDAFVRYQYPNEIGPGVYDIHSPRVPPQEEMMNLISKALTVLSPTQVWINPDCGLKTRRWEEVIPALKVMVNAAKEARTQVSDRKEPLPSGKTK